MPKDKLYKVRLSEHDKDFLENILRTSHNEIECKRSRILLAFNENNNTPMTYDEYIARYGGSKKTISRTIFEFFMRGLDSVGYDARRRDIVELEEQILQKLNNKPTGKKRWTLRLLEQATGINKNIINNILRKNNIDLKTWDYDLSSITEPACKAEINPDKTND